MAGKWEFVGGKIEPHETPENALIREIREELAVDCRVMSHFTTDSTMVGDLRITLRCYLASFESQPIASSDHDAFRWLTGELLWTVDWAEADIPAVQLIDASDLLSR